MLKLTYSESSSTAAQHVSWWKYFSHPSLALYFFFPPPKPTHKTKTRTANRFENSTLKIEYFEIIYQNSPFSFTKCFYLTKVFKNII
jgi:hypothetical protein